MPNSSVAQPQISAVLGEQRTNRDLLTGRVCRELLDVVDDGLSSPLVAMVEEIDYIRYITAALKQTRAVARRLFTTSFSSVSFNS